MSLNSRSLADGPPRIKWYHAHRFPAAVINSGTLPTRRAPYRIARSDPVAAPWVLLPRRGTYGSVLEA